MSVPHDLSAAHNGIENSVNLRTVRACQWQLRQLRPAVITAAVGGIGAVSAAAVSAASIGCLVNQ